VLLLTCVAIPCHTAGCARPAVETRRVPVAAESVSIVSRDTTTVRSYDGRSMSAEIIRLRVPERRADPETTITVAALRIQSSASHPGAPIVFLMGGPGIPGSVMAPIPPYFTLFQRLRELADVVIIDQRGIGRSTPELDCAADDELPPDLFVRRAAIVRVIRDRIAACASQFRNRGIDPTAYTTIESADDIEDLRKALGAERFDLLAFSYGTRLALMYVQRQGDHVGRLALQGVNGPGLVLKRPAPFARKLDRISRLLARDSTWRAPTDLRAAARAALERLARTPSTVTVTDRRTQRQLELAVGRDGLDALVNLNLDDARLPALLISVAGGDDRVLARFVEDAWNGLAGGTAGLMGRAVNCAADRPESRWQRVRSEATTGPFGIPLDDDVLTEEFCRAVGYGAPPSEFGGAVRSAVPALFLTGSLDATNPIENATAVAGGFSNAVSLEVANGVHEMLTVPAVQDAVVDWFLGADVRGRHVVAPPPRFATVEEAAAPYDRGPPGTSSVGGAAAVSHSVGTGLRHSVFATSTSWSSAVAHPSWKPIASWVFRVSGLPWIATAR